MKLGPVGSGGFVFTELTAVAGYPSSPTAEDSDAADVFEAPGPPQISPLFSLYNPKHLDEPIFYLLDSKTRITPRQLLERLRDADTVFQLNAEGNHLMVQIEEFREGGSIIGSHGERHALVDALMGLIFLKLRRSDGSTLFQRLVNLLGMPKDHRNDADHIAGFSREEMLSAFSKPSDFPIHFRSALGQAIRIWGDRHCFADEMVIFPSKRAAKAGFRELLEAIEYD